MKRIYDNLLLLLLCLSGLCSCDDVMDTHKAFIQGGEIIYARYNIFCCREESGRAKL